MSMIGNALTTLANILGNLNFTGTGNRITGDFSNATESNRVAFKTSTVNGKTVVPLYPDGTGAEVGFSAPTVPMTFYTGGAERMRIDTSGNVTIPTNSLTVTNASGGLGYGTGAGGTVTQATSKSTAVTLNKPTGVITMNSASLAAGASVTFTLNNSLIGANDTVLLSGSNAGPTTTNYRIDNAINVAAGSCGIRVTNISGGAQSDSVPINFAIIKGAAS